MKAFKGNREKERTTEDIRRIAALAAAVRVICIANHLRLPEHSLIVTRHPKPPVEIAFTGREPFGFAFTAGHEAAFQVPSGHRFVIEHLDLSCWAKNGHIEVQLVTRSPHMFRQVTLTRWPEQRPLGQNGQAGTTAPILVNESTANTLLFSNGELHSSSTVPPETYLQLWGYLEPAYEAECA